jgi:hypothetical protein
MVCPAARRVRVSPTLASGRRVATRRTTQLPSAVVSEPTCRLLTLIVGIIYTLAGLRR